MDRANEQAAQEPQAHLYEGVPEEQRTAHGLNRLSRTKLHRSWLILLVFLTAVAIRIYLVSITDGYTEDHGFFMMWADILRAVGFWQSYNTDVLLNYPPVFIAFLRGYITIIDALGFELARGGYWVRMPAILFDIGAMLVFLVLTRRAEYWRRLTAFSFFAWNPTLIYAGSVWGQIDILHSTLMVLALWLIKRPYLAGFLYAVALLTKFQSIMIAPVIVFYFAIEWSRTGRISPLARYAAGFLSPILLLFSYFIYHGTLKNMLQQAYFSAVDLYPYVTLNAPNIWYYLIGIDPWTLDNTIVWSIVSYKHIGISLVLAAVCWIGYGLFRQRLINRVTLLISGATLTFAFFMLATQMHERYIIPALVCLCFVAALDSRWYIIAVPLTLTSFINLVLVMNESMTPGYVISLAIINVILLGYMFFCVFGRKRRGNARIL